MRARVCVCVGVRLEIHRSSCRGDRVICRTCASICSPVTPPETPETLPYSSAVSSNTDKTFPFFRRRINLHLTSVAAIT